MRLESEACDWRLRLTRRGANHGVEKGVGQVAGDGVEASLAALGPVVYLRILLLNYCTRFSKMDDYICFNHSQKSIDTQYCINGYLKTQDLCTKQCTCKLGMEA